MSKLKTSRDDIYSLEHCKQRYLERYNEHLNLDKYKKWNNDIKNKLSNKYQENITIISTEKSVVISHIIKITDDNNKIYCSFEEDRNCITTFLPIESVEKKINKNKKKQKNNKN